MVSLDNAVIARLKTHGEIFEIYVDPDLALKYKEGSEVNIEDILAVETVFKDASAGEKASEHTIKKIFETTDIKAITEKILTKGEVHLTAEQKRKKIEEKKKQIITIIARNALNPQTGNPHPPNRIEKAMDEARVTINMNKSVREQVDVVLKAIKPLIPIRFSTISFAIKIPSEYSGNCYSILKGFGEIKKEEWDKNGDLMCLVETPAGLQDEFHSKLNGLTHGEVQIKIIKTT